MKNTLFTGAGIAIITPFNEDGSINYERLGEMIDYQIENGTDAIIICGTTGEASTMSDEEHLECIRFAVKIFLCFQLLFMLKERLTHYISNESVILFHRTPLNNEIMN